MRFLTFALLGGLFIGLAGCKDQSIPVNVQTEVKNSQGEPVDAAVVRINGTEIGRTDANGKFSGAAEFSAGETIKIEISKDSSKFYYAPYYNTVTVPQQGTLHLPVAAVLYFVPKPSADGQAVAEEKTKNASPDTSEKQPVLTTEAASSTESASEKDSATTETVAEPSSESEQELVALPKEESKPEKKSPTLPKPNNEVTVFTAHVYSGGQPVRSAEVFWGNADQGSLRKGCVTNRRGRCTVTFQSPPEGMVTFLAKKKSYQTASRTVAVTQGGTLRFNIKRGVSIDIFAVTKKYNYTRGVTGVAVYIKGEQVGHTDQFGHFAYVYAGKKDDLVDIRLKSQGYLPEEYETDFVASGPTSLVRYFTPAAPPKVRIAMLRARPAGRLDKTAIAKTFGGNLDKYIARAADKNIFSSPAFGYVQEAKFAKGYRKTGKSEESILRKGWATTDLKGSVDAVLLPTLVLSSPQVLEVSIIDSRGRAIAAAKETLSGDADQRSVDHAVAVIAKKLARRFPFEGAVLGKDGKQITINIGSASGRSIKAGDRVDVYGVQSDEFGKKQTHKKIARLRIKEVWDELSRGDVENLEKRSTIHRGDLVVLRQQRSGSSSSTLVKVNATEAGGKVVPTSQANVYLDNRWLGSTDRAGKMHVPVKMVGATGNLKIVKHGYKDFSREVRLSARRTLSVSLKRAMAFVRVESEPSDAEVFVDGRSIGKTPVSTPMAVPSGFAKLEIKGPGAYKTYAAVLDFEEGAIDLTGGQRITLERDYMHEAEALLREGKTQVAMAKMRAIPENHSDYLMAAHRRGEIYLAKLNQPVNAAKAFGIVTSHQGVKNFNDKRFIASYINEGLALFKVAENFGGDNAEAAAAHYLKAMESFEKVEPFLRFVPKGQFSRAVNNVSFHRALSKQRLYETTQNPVYLNGAFKDWRRFVNNGRDSKRKSDDSAFLKNAEVYLKQTKGLLAKLEKVN